MRSSMLLTLGAIGFALATAPAVASEDAAPEPNSVETVQTVAGADPALDSVDPVATSEATADSAAAADEMAGVTDTPEPAAAPAMDVVAGEGSASDVPAGLDPEVDPEADAPAMQAETAPIPDPQQAPPSMEEVPVANEASVVSDSESMPAAPDPFVEAAEPAEAAASSPSESEGPTLGSVGYDSDGQRGRIHVVVPGDTLWDISDAYLSTPWVWPSIWTDNRNIENPHLIYPGDHIWITRSEMRVVSPEEVEQLLSGQPPETAAEEALAEAPAAPDAGAETMAGEDLAPHTPTAPSRPKTTRVSELENVGLVTAEDFDASASIVEAQVEKMMLSQGDLVYIGLGAGDVEKGDQFTIFRKVERVFDPDTGRLIGYHVEILGWLEATEVTEEASLAVIRHSSGEIERGDRLVPREVVSPEIAMVPSPVGVDGRISFFASSRTMMGGVDYVYLNRGTLDGVEPGSPLEVFRPGRLAPEPTRHTQVQVPDRIVAELLVVKAEPNSSVAFVSHAETELELGDRFRGSSE